MAIPLLGDNVKKFNELYGEPLVAGDSQNTYEVSNDTKPMSTSNFSEFVHTINWTIPVDKNLAIATGEKFLPEEFKMTNEWKGIRNQFLNAEEPLDVYEYYCKSLEENEGNIESEYAGYVTIYVAEVDEELTNIVVSLGREPLLIN